MTRNEEAEVKCWGEALRDADPERRAEAAERLSRAGEAAAAAAVPLVRSCMDDEDRVREWAVAALEDMGPPPPDAVPPLVDLARGGDALAAYWAVTLLGRVGQDAEPAVPALIACVTSAGEISVRQRAAWALGCIGPGAAAAREALGRAAGDPDERLARLAKEALDSIEGAARS